MRQQDAQLLTAGFNLRPLGPWVLYMVEVIDGHSAGDGIIVLAAAVLEHGMEGKDGELLLQGRLDGFVLFFRYFSATALFECVFYLGTRLCHLHRVECRIQEVGRTFAHLATYIFCYSKHFFDVLLNFYFYLCRITN